MAPVTKQNVEALIDSGALYVAVVGGKWARVRRTGETAAGSIPVRVGYSGRFSIGPETFDGDADLSPDDYRQRDDVPAALRAYE